MMHGNLVGPGQGRPSAIHDFIAHDSSYYAKKITQEIVIRTDVLDELPCMGRIVTEFGNEAIRELSLNSYRILYEIKAEYFRACRDPQSTEFATGDDQAIGPVYRLKKEIPQLRKSSLGISYGE